MKITNAKPGKQEWTISQEREYMENLLCQRFNFLIVFYGLIVAGAFTTNVQLHMQILLSLGTFIVIPISITIAAVQWNVDKTVQMINRDPNHPMTLLNKAAHNLNARWLIGYYAPCFCSLSVIVGAILSLLNILKTKTG